MTGLDQSKVEVPIIAGNPIAAGDYILRHEVIEVPEANRFDVTISVADVSDPVDVREDNDGILAVAFKSFVTRTLPARYNSAPRSDYLMSL